MEPYYTTLHVQEGKSRWIEIRKVFNEEGEYLTIMNLKNPIDESNDLMSIRIMDFLNGKPYTFHVKDN